MRIKKGDLVKKIAGKDKGKQGKVIKTIPKENKIVVEKMNIIKKHRKPKREGEKGQIVEIAASFDCSNAMIICPSCSKAVKVSYSFVSDKKVRVCKKCNKEL